MTRVAARKLLGFEPRITVSAQLPLEFHGTSAGGWMIRRDSLRADSIIVDVGLGEDASFPMSLIRKYGCVVNGFDPTPRALKYMQRFKNDHLRLFGLGIGVQAGRADFFLPNNEAHVSGSISREPHLGTHQISVELITLAQVFDMLACERIDLLKLDIEGTEYDVLCSADFRQHGPAVGQLCVEFHHRWASHGKGSTEHTVQILRSLGFECAWSSQTTNEEFLFVNTRWPGAS